MVGADYLYWQSIERNGALNGIIEKDLVEELIN